jgi:chromosome segregation ATPase
MRKAFFILAVLSGLIAAGAAHGQAPKTTSPSGKQTYKWVDEKGVTHYGDHVPSEYSQREQRVLNEQGLEVQKRQAELSPAEAMERAKKQKEESQRKQHDMFLISTYPSTREIESVRDTRLDQINGQISAAEAYIASLTTRVDGLKERSKMFAPYNKTPGARRMPDDLAEEMVRTLSELRTQNSALASRRSEARAVTEQFDGDIRRFKELRTSAAARLNDANRPKKQ